MAKVANLSADLVANTAQFESGLSRATRQLDSAKASWNRSLSSLDKGFKGLGGSVQKFGGEIFSLKGAAAAVIGTVGGAGLVELATHALEAVGGLGELASQIGVTTDTLQAFRYAATQVGLSQDEMDAGLTKLTKTIGEAADGNQTAIDTFEGLGVKILDANGNVRSTDAVMRDAADAIAALPDPAQRAAAAVALMGKAGQKMLPFMEGGAAGINAFIQQAKDLGLVFDEETIRRADEASDKLATMSQVIGARLTAALVNAAPLMNAFADSVIKVIESLNSFYANRSGAPQTLTNLQQELQDTQHYIDLMQKKSDEMNKSDFWAWANQGADKEIEKAKARVAELQAALAQIGPSFEQKGRSDALPRSNIGVSNPKPTSTGSGGKSQAQKDAEAASKAIADLQFQLDQLGRSELDQKIASALKGFTGTKEQAQQVRDLVTAAHEQAQAQADVNAGLEQEAALRERGKQLADSLMTPVERYRAALQDINQLEQQGAIDNTAALRAKAQAYEDYRKALGVTDIIEANKTPLEKYNDQIAHLNDLMATGELTADQYNRAVAGAQDAFEKASDSSSDFKDSMRDASQVIGTAFEDAILKGGDLSDIFKGLEEDINRIIFRLTVTKPLENFLGGLIDGKGSGGSSSGLVDFLGGLFGPSKSTPSAAPGSHADMIGGAGASGGSGGFGWLSGLFSWFGGFFADGGTPPTNKWSIIGENGPELWRPNTAGTVISNHEIAAAMAGGGSPSVMAPVVVNVHGVKDVDSFNRSRGQVAQGAGRAIQRMIERNG